MNLLPTTTAERTHFFPSWVDGRETSLADDYESARERIAASIDGDDLMDELHDVRDELAQLARDGKCDEIGAVVVAIQRAFVQRLTDREIFGKPGVRAMGPFEAMNETVQQLKALTLIVNDSDATKNTLVRAHRKASAERF